MYIELNTKVELSNGIELDSLIIILHQCLVDFEKKEVQALISCYSSLKAWQDKKEPVKMHSIGPQMPFKLEDAELTGNLPEILYKKIVDAFKMIYKGDEVKLID